MDDDDDTTPDTTCPLCSWDTDDDDNAEGVTKDVDKKGENF